MAYSTVFEVRAAVSPLGGSDNPPASATGTAADLPNATIVDSIAEADSTIDAYIGGRYIVPVAPNADGTTIPHPIDFWSRNIAAYLATLTARGGQDFTDTDPVARRYIATMTALTAVRDGKAVLEIPSLADTPGANASEGAGDPINPNGFDALFSEEQFDVDVVGGSVRFNTAEAPYGWYGWGRYGGRY